MLSLALVLDEIMPMLWVFALTQLYIGLIRSWQRSAQIKNDVISIINK